jgi:iron complex outermembrane receptor protein
MGVSTDTVKHMKKLDGSGWEATGLVAGLITAGFAPVVGAQSAAPATEEEPVELEEVLVSATKRMISVKDVPLAVSAISGASLEQNKVAGIESLTNIDPAFQAQSRGPGDTQIIIRGIQSGGASLVSVYMDEAVVTGGDFNGNGGRQTGVQLYDIERVEILKGPQGTLFGSGSMAGTLRVIARKPAMNEYQFGASLSAEGGSGTNPLYEAHVMANLPLVSDELALRLVAWNSDGGGFLDRTDEPRPMEDTNDQHIKGVRAIGEWRPNSNLKLTLTALTQDIDVDDLNFYRRNSGKYVIGAPAMGLWDEGYHLYSLVGEYQLNSGTITAAASYSQRRIFWSNDTTPIAGVLGLPGAYQYNEYQDRAITSSEIRFASAFEGPLQVVAGVFFEADRDEAENIIGVTVPGNGNIACPTFDACRAASRAEDVVSGRALQHNADQYAVFAQAEYALTPTLTLTAGVRYYRATLDWEELQLQGLRRSLTDPVQNTPLLTLDEKETQTDTGYNLSLGWRPTTDLSFYVRAASGFRLGGINSLSVRQVDPTVPVSYGSDELWNYEVGAKANFFDRRLTLDSAIYFIDWTGQQVSTPSSAGVFFYIDNAGKSRVKGAELALTAYPTDRLTLSAGLTYTDSRLAEDQPTAATDPAAGRDGDRLPLVPKWSGTGLVRYEFPVGTREYYAQANYTYRGTSYTNFHPGASYVPMESYSRVDLAFGARVGNWNVSLFAKNLTDEAAQLGVVPLTGVVSAGDAAITTIRPRTFGVKVSTSF